MNAITPATPRAARMALATAMDHNVGLGPRWEDDLTEPQAMQHVNEVAALYRQAVEGTLGPKGLSAVPLALAKPAAGAFPARWRALVGDPASGVRIRAGQGFLHPIIDDAAPILPVATSVTGDERRMLVHARLDRAQIEARAGPHRFNTVIEIRLKASAASLRLAPEDSPSAQAGRWLLGAPQAIVIAPEAVRVTGPGMSLRVHAPLMLAWSLVRDQTDPSVTWLQGLAFVDVNEGRVQGGMLQRSFAMLYPGEPVVVDFDIELERTCRASPVLPARRRSPPACRHRQARRQASR